MKLMLVAIALVTFATIAASALAQTETNNSANSNTAETKPSPTATAENAPLKLDSPQAQMVREKFDQYSTYASRWSGVYWGSVFGAAILSALAGLTVKLDALKDKKLLTLSQTDLAALLAGSAALLITISSAGDFAGKWRTNRTAKNRSEQLRNEVFYNPKLTSQEVGIKLNKIIDDQNNGVINAKDEKKP